MSTMRQRHTKSRRNKRRSHLKLQVPQFVSCSHCKALVLPHRVCVYCGYYGGAEVIDTLAKLTKKERKKKEKEEAARKAAAEEHAEKPETLGAAHKPPQL